MYTYLLTNSVFFWSSYQTLYLFRRCYMSFLIFTLYTLFSFFTLLRTNCPHVLSLFTLYLPFFKSFFFLLKGLVFITQQFYFLGKCIGCITYLLLNRKMYSNILKSCNSYFFEIPEGPKKFQQERYQAYTEGFQCTVFELRVMLL